MIVLFCAFLSLLSFANPTLKWSNTIEIVEKHEFYKNNEVITKPENSWQVLFAVVYRDSNMVTFKDCLFYRVPGLESGILKLKTISAEKSCSEFIFTEGQQEWTGLKSLQFSIENSFLSLNITNSKYETEKWDIPFFNVYQRPIPKILSNSAEYRSPQFIFLNPHKGNEPITPQKGLALKDKTICHNVTDTCEEKSPSVCYQCEHGWFEIPNGCQQGPKFCGPSECGLKHQPACRRGMKYQRKTAEFDCRSDQSFAYCAKGLSIQCQGNLPYCL
jgi:hypothetical protein